MKILAIIQARTSSSRLPNKVLKPILGKPMLIHQIERVQLSKTIDQLVIATSKDASDDKLINLLKNINVEYYRGSLNDVLDRFIQAASGYKPSHVVRLTGDCPVIDFEIIDKVIKFHLDNGSDYTSNCFPPTYPDGLDVEVVKFSVLEEAWRHAELPSEREHVMPYIRNHPDFFSSSNVEFEKDLSNHRWTVDEPEDFEFVEKIYTELYSKNKKFNMQDILNLIDKNPCFKDINYHIARNEGAIKSYEEDKEYLSKKNE